MPDVTYPKNANSDTVFVEDGGKKTRAIKTVEPDGTVTYPSNANSENCYVTVDGKKQRALMTAPQDTSTLEYPNNPNSTKGYVTVNGKKQRVVITANIAGGGSAPVIDELNVTPSTSAQTITAPSGKDGYSPVNVSAVDASIDANITANNIKDGVTILGVTGNVVELNGETKTVTPQVYGQTLYPTSPKNAITEITVNAVTSSIDANIQAGNIKDGVTILGVTGNYTGGAPALYREFQLGNNGVLIPNKTTTHIMNFTGVTSVTDYGLASAYMLNTAISGAVDMSDLTTLNTPYCVYAAFMGCSGITSANLSSLTTISSSCACLSMFQDCVNITSINLSALTTVSGNNGCQAMFYNCSGITSANLSSLTTISGNYGCQSMFFNCTGLTSATLSSLNTITGNYACTTMFAGCTNLTSLSFPAIKTTSFGTRVNIFSNMCQNIPSITLHFPSNTQAKIESLTGYSATAPFGATSGSVLFDLPATE